MEEAGYKSQTTKVKDQCANRYINKMRHGLKKCTELNIKTRGTQQLTAGSAFTKLLHVFSFSCCFLLQPS